MKNLNFNQIFKNCKTTTEHILQAIEKGASKEQLEAMAFEMQVEKVKLEDGGWFDIAHSKLVWASNSWM